MRASASRNGMRVHAIAGTHTVLLGFDLADPAGCLGFAIHRTDHTEDEAYWLRGMKTFPSLVPKPPPGTDYATAEHPVQGFQWGDYTAKPEHDYTYRVSAMGGVPGGLVPILTASVQIRTEATDDGVHGVHFNRGVAGSQAFARAFPDGVPAQPDESSPAMTWLSRGLGEAFCGFVGEAVGPGWGLRGAFYELTWPGGLAALAAARARGVDLRLVVHGRTRGADDTTASDARAAAASYGLDVPGLLHWRDAANLSALQHHKFLVLTHDGLPVAVWTGSTNLTLGAIYGHSNVGHLVRDPVVAATFLAEWEALASPATTAQLRTAHAADNVVEPVVPAPDGLTTVFSPRSGSAVLDWYGVLFASARSSAHITGAFGLNAVFRTALATPEPRVMRTVLLDKPASPGAAVPRTDPMVRISTGAHLSHGALGQWAGEQLTGFNGHVPYIHTKIILIDPLTPRPTVLSGSANYSTASTETNEEHTLVLRSGGRRSAATRAAAVRRVADIYLTEYHRLFMHFVFRAWADRINPATGKTEPPSPLWETDGWTRLYYEPGAWRSQQRLLFSGQSAA